jgi:hypothetical protein
VKAGFVENDESKINFLLLRFAVISLGGGASSNSGLKLRLLNVNSQSHVSILLRNSNGLGELLFKEGGAAAAGGASLEVTMLNDIRGEAFSGSTDDLINRQGETDRIPVTFECIVQFDTETGSQLLNAKDAGQSDFDLFSMIDLFLFKTDQSNILSLINVPHHIAIPRAGQSLGTVFSRYPNGDWYTDDASGDLTVDVSAPDISPVRVLIHGSNIHSANFTGSKDCSVQFVCDNDEDSLFRGCIPTDPCTLANLN